MKTAAVVLIAGVLSIAAVESSTAAIIPVDTTDDEYVVNPTNCSLREAVWAASADQPFDGCPAGEQNDTILLPGGTYKVTIPGIEDLNAAGDFDVAGAGDVTLKPEDPADRVVLDGNGLDRVIQYTGDGRLTLEDLTVTGGRAASAGGIDSSAGALTLDGVTVTDNQATAGNRGGVEFGMGGRVVNSTISGNGATGSGGGFGVSPMSVVSVRSTTIVGNEADTDGDGTGNGGGFGSFPLSNLRIVNSISFGNRDLSPNEQDRYHDCSKSMTYTSRYNLFGEGPKADNCLEGGILGTNRIVADAGLSPLGDNGGSTFTHAPVAGSPLIDSAGSMEPDLCPEADQVGTVRAPGKCDIGAVEYVEPVIPEPEPDPQPLPGIKVPSNTKAMWDGKNLHVRLKCPARFRPRCLSAAVPVTLKSKKGRAMAKTVKVSTKPNRWRRIKFTIKPAYRAKIDAMTFRDAKLLVVKQMVRSKRVGYRKAKRPAAVFHTYKVRIKA